MKSEELDNGKKPEAPQWLIDNIAEASKNTRKIYLMYLGFLAYCALTAISTTDRTLVLNEPAHLPIVNVGVPLEGFFIFAPILAIMTFIYFQFYLQKLNNLKSEHEKDFGKIDENRIYPWIVNFLDFPQRGFVGFLQKFVVKFALWWSLPSVLIIFALYYVKKHDLWMSYYLGLLPLITTVLVVLFRINYEKEKFGTFIKENKFGLTMVALLLIAQILFMACIIPWSMQGGKYDFLRKWICVDLSYQKLVTEPETDYEGLYWADFYGIHLEGAFMRFVVLKRADLRKAHLRGADLSGAKLQQANLWSANLQGADLERANLQKASLPKANLQGADLRRTDSLTIQQLSVVKTLYKAELDSALFEQVRAEYPHLLEEPPIEEEKEE